MWQLVAMHSKFTFSCFPSSFQGASVPWPLAGLTSLPVLDHLTVHSEGCARESCEAAESEMIFYSVSLHRTNISVNVFFLMNNLWCSQFVWCSLKSLHSGISACIHLQETTLKNHPEVILAKKKSSSYQPETTRQVPLFFVSLRQVTWSHENGKIALRRAFMDQKKN